MKLQKTLSSSVKFSRSTVITAIIVFVSMAFLPNRDDSFNEKTDQLFQNQLQDLKKQLISFKSLSGKKGPSKSLQQQFIQSRTAYKKLAVLSEYFNPYETKFLNGPALERAEDGTPDVIIPPQGFQAIEEIVYGELGAASHSELNKLLERMLTTIDKLDKEIDRQNKFRTESVWDALRSATVRLMALGITGFDSPVAFRSLPEARSTIEGMKNTLMIFKVQLDAKAKGDFERLMTLLTAADKYLTKNRDFNSFDRLSFITDYLEPVYKQLVATRNKAGISVPQGRQPVNVEAVSVFQRDFFNINFFSPGQEYWMTDKRVALGKKLFADPVLSGTKDRSCASCHSPGKGFADGLKVPTAMGGSFLSRNTPGLWNSALQTRQFYDVRTDILENQLKEVVHSTEEMEGSLALSVTDLKKNPEYVRLFNESYGSEREPINAYNIANAISSYIRSLISLDSRFDDYMLGKKSALTDAEQKGFNLFSGKAKCATCHFIPLFNGLVPPEFVETETEVLGVPETTDKTKPRLDPDLGKYNTSKSVIHKHSFKTPTVRNIELTAPYMHNGVFNSLEEVLDFYNDGGGQGLKIAPENQTLPPDKLNLTKKEMQDIIAFMKSLTGKRAREYE